MNRTDLLMQAMVKRKDAQVIRDMSRRLSSDADRAVFERDAQELEREAERLEGKAAAEKS
jgi:hypothetical protein